jgi:ectoine hydroxylase-related dioxygenase (phytanoyl-CoA dioxygenase family)
MTPGEAFVFLGSTVHAGGANLTSQSRPVHGFFFCRSYIRPEVSRRSICECKTPHPDPHLVQLPSDHVVGKPVFVVDEERDRKMVSRRAEAGWICD